MTRFVRAVVLLSMALAVPAFAATFSSVQSGDWNSAATWGGTTVPGVGDAVTVNAPHVVGGTAPMKAASVQIGSGATLNPTDGSTLGAVTLNGTMAPDPGATITVSTFPSGGTFTSNGGTVVVSGTSAAIGLRTYASLTIATGATVGVNGASTVTETLTLNGSLTIPANVALQVRDVVAGAASSLTIDANNAGLRVGGNFTAANDHVPFGFPTTSTSFGLVIFNGTTPQTLTGGPFMPLVRVGEGGSTQVSGKLRTNQLQLFTSAVASAADGSEVGSISGSGTLNGPPSGAITAGNWAVGTFTANGSTVTLGPTSWGSGSTNLAVASGLTFANLTIPFGTTVTNNGNLQVTGTFQLDGAWKIGTTNRINHLTTSANASITYSVSAPMVLTGNFTSAGANGPFGAPTTANTRQVQFVGTTPQTIVGNPFLPTAVIGDGSTASDVSGAMRTNSAAVFSSATFRPGSGSELGMLQITGVSNVIPATNATLTVGGWSVPSFVANGSTVTAGPTSWGATNGGTLLIGGSTFANLTIAAGAAVVLTNPTVTGTLTINGTATLSGSVTVNDVVAAASSSIVFNTSAPFTIKGNFTSASTSAPFGAPNAAAANTNVLFNGTTTQTLSDDLFIPSFTVGNGTVAVTVTGRVRANLVSIIDLGTFKPTNGAELGRISTFGTGQLAPANGATVTAGAWNVGSTAFTPNAGTIILGPTSWGSGQSGLIAPATFANLTIASGWSITSSSQFTVSNTLTLNGALTASGGQVKDFVVGSNGSLTLPGSPLRVSGSMTTANSSVPFGAPNAATTSGVLAFNGVGTQTISGNPFIPSVGVGDGGATILTGRLRANVVTLAANSTFAPADGTELGALSLAGAATVAPVAGAKVTAGGWSSPSSFTPNSSTIILGATSWGAGSSTFTVTGSASFYNLEIPATSTISFSAPTLQIGGTFTLDGSATLTGGKVGNVVAGAASSLTLSFQSLLVTGDFSTASMTAPFGAASLSATGTVQFIGTGTQTITGSPFLPSATIGDGASAVPTVAGRLRTNNLTIANGAKFQPADGSELRNFMNNASGVMDPVAGASITVTVWASPTLRANGGTVVFGPVSWESGNVSGSVGGNPPFANVTVASAFSGTAQGLNVAGTLTLDGTLHVTSSSLVKDLVAHAGSSLDLQSGVFRLTGDFTGTGNAPFGAPNASATTTIAFLANGTQTIFGNPYIPNFTVNDGTKVTTVQGAVRTNSVILGPPSTTFLPGNGSEIGSLVCSFDCTVRPAAGASLTIAGANINSFDANGSNVRVGKTSWGSGSDATTFNYATNATLTFADLTVPAGASFAFSNVVANSSLAVTGTLRLDGTLTSNFSPAQARFHDVVVGTAGAFTLNAGGFIDGNFSTSNPDAPFGPPSASASTPLRFNGTTPQTIAGNPFIPTLGIGVGLTTTVSGKVRTTSLSMVGNAIFKPADGSEFGNISEAFPPGGQITPDPGATIRVASSWTATSGFDPNGGTVIIGPTSWITPALFSSNAAVLFDTLSFENGATAILTGATWTVRRNVTVDGTVQHGFLRFGGTTLQSLSGAGSLNLDSLEVANVQGVKASMDVTTTMLGLTNGKLATSRKVSIANNGSVTRTNGWVAGTLERPVSNSSPVTFDVGGATAYSPVVLSNAVGASLVGVSASEETHPTPLGTNALKRYWSVSAPGLTNATLECSYLPTDVPTLESTLRLAQFSGGAWLLTGDTPNPTTHKVSRTTTTFGDFSLVQPAASLAFGPINGGVSPRATVPFPVNVRAVDANGGTTMVFQSTDVHLDLDPANPGSGFLSGTLSGTIPAGSSSVTLTPVTYSTTSSNVRLRAQRGVSGETLSAGISAPLTFLSLAANHLGISAPATPTVGTPFSVTVSALDANGVVDTGYRGMVHFTSSDPSGVGPADYAFSAADFGQHTFTITLQSSGVQSITFTDTTTSSLTATVNVTASKAAATTTLTAGPNPSTFGQSVTLTASVQPVAPASATPQGTVTFRDGTTDLGTVALSAGSASLPVTTLPVGTRALTAVYNGSSVYNGSTSAPVGQTVNVSATTTTLSTAPSATVYGQNVSFSIVVAPDGPGGGFPSGTVSLLEGTTTLGTATLDGTGHASYNLANLAVGAHTITASYAGSANHSASTSNAVTQNVGKSSSTISVATSDGTTLFGEPVTFTATIAPLSPGAGTLTGTVELFDGATSLGTAAVGLTSNIQFTVSALSVTTHAISAKYSGDGNFLAATSAAITQTVGQATPIATLVSSASPSAFGQSVTFTATLSATSGTPTGTVTFTDGSTTLAAVPLANAVATFTTSALALGAHPISASYGGDATFTGATASLTQNVDATATSVVVSANPSPATMGESVTVAATVTSATAVTPTGNVTFKEGTTTLATRPLVAGVASFSVATLGAGSHSIIAAYEGDTNNSAASGSATLTVNRAATTTTIQTSSPITVFRSNVNFTIRVTPAVSGTPTGSVTISEGASTLATVPLSGGVATFMTSALNVGGHSLTATYLGDSDFNASAGGLNHTVVKAGPQLTVASSVPSSTFGQSVTLLATITAAGGTPSGTVRFFDDGHDLGVEVGLDGGSAAHTISTLSVGFHNITASYSGDASYTTTTSPAFGQTVTAAPSTISLLSSAEPSAFGQNVTFTAMVGNGATGNVAFSDGASSLGTVALSAGSAQFTTSALAVGTHLIQASYAGDTSHQSASTTVAQHVTTTPTTTSLVPSANPAPFGTSLTLTANIASSIALGGGTVSFYEGATLLDTVPVSGASAALAIGAARTPGAYSFTANYSGTATHAASSSSALALTVDPAGTSVSLVSSTNPSAVNATITLTATVTSTTGVTPIGSITFYDGVASLGSAALTNGVATFDASFAAGPHALTAAYSGSANFLGSTSSVLTQTATNTATLTSLTPPAMCQSAAGFTLAIHGSGFDANTRVQWDGAPRTTTFVDANTLTIAIATDDLAIARDVTVSALDAGNNAIATARTFTVDADATPPVVVAPQPIRVTQTVCTPDGPGARGADVPALASFLQSATATDSCSTPIAMAPQVAGHDVDANTVFAGGDTEVTFRYRDAAGNITPSTSTVTVQLFGDLSTDGRLDATDRLILENYLVGNLQQGTAPFTAPLAAADVNHDGNVDATDSLLMANQLVGNIGCLSASGIALDASAQIGVSPGRARPVRVAGMTKEVPIRIAAAGPGLGSYVARVSFDPSRVTVQTIRGGASTFGADPIATDLAAANRSGVLRLTGVQLDPNAPAGDLDVARVLFVETAPGGLATVDVAVESVAFHSRRKAQ